MVRILIVLVCVFVGAETFAFEGTIRFTIQHSGIASGMESLLLPNAYTIYTKGGTTVIKVDGGKLADQLGDVVYIGSTGKTYLVRHTTKSYYLLPTVQDDQTYTVVQTQEKQTIAGYVCFKYLLKEKGSEAASLIVWASPSLKIPLPTNGKSQGIGSLSFAGIEGTPFMIEDVKQGTGIKMKVDQISTSVPSGVAFIIPNEYVLKVLE